MSTSAGTLRAFAALLAISGALLLVTQHATAGSVAVVSDDPSVALTDGKDGGWVASVGLTNLTSERLSVSAAPRTDGCRLVIGDGTATIDAAQHSSVDVVVQPPCDVSAGLRFAVVVSGPGVDQTASFMAKRKTGSAVDWSALLWFVGSFGVSAVVVLATTLLWLSSSKGTGRGAGGWTSLRGLGTTWSFKDSVVSNLTAASGLVVIFLGSSDFLKTALGTKAEVVIAQASIAGAIALALLGAAGVLALTVRTPGSGDATIAGLACASAVALGASGGQVWTITWLLHRLDLGRWGAVILWVAAGLATVVLLAYTVTMLVGFFGKGTEPDPGPLSGRVPDEVLAAVVIAQAIGGQTDRKSVTERLDSLTRDGSAGSELADRSIML